LRSRFKDRPRPLLRILIFDALRRAAGQSAPLAAALWLTAESIFPHLKHGREKALFEKVLLSYAQQTEQQAVSSEEGTQVAELPKAKRIKLPAVALQGNTIDFNDFSGLMNAAFFAANPADRFKLVHPPNNDSGANPYNSQQHPHWAMAAASRLTEVMALVVNASSQRLATQINGQLAELIATTKQILEQHAADLYAGVQAQQQQARNQSVRLKTDVLWWLESLYSQTLRRSFRTLSPPIASVAMPYDLFGSINTSIPTPASVIHVVGEAVTRLKDVSDAQRYPLRQLLHQIHEHREQLQPLIEGHKSAKSRAKGFAGRRPLLYVIEATVLNALPPDDAVQAQTGLAEDVTLTLPELAMWCFRDLEARHLCKSQGAA